MTNTVNNSMHIKTMHNNRQPAAMHLTQIGVDDPAQHDVDEVLRPHPAEADHAPDEFVLGDRGAAPHMHIVLLKHSFGHGCAAAALSP